MFLRKKPHAKPDPPQDAASTGAPNGETSATPPQPGETPEQDAVQTPSPADLSPADIAQLQAKAAEGEEWHTKCLYAVAELDNFRKRTAKERRDMLNYAGQEILFGLLEVLDNFDRALDADRKESNPAVIVEGIEMIRKQLGQIVDKFGVKPIEAIGVMFDPKVHEALQHVAAPDTRPGTVVYEMQKGYMLRDRVLRPARVVVAAEPPAASESSDRSDKSDKSDKSDRSDTESTTD